MLTITWNSKRVIVWRKNNPIHTIYLNGRNPYRVYSEVKNRIIKTSNVIQFRR